MLFLVKAKNTADSAELRSANIPAHVDYLDRYKERFIAGGPVLSDDGEHVTGTMMVLDMPSRKALDDFLADEPYNKAGLFEKIEITRWRFGKADVNRKDIVLS